MTTPLDSAPISPDTLQAIPSSYQAQSTHPLSPQGRFTRMSFLAWLFITGLFYTAILFIGFGFGVYSVLTYGVDFADFSPLSSTFSGWIATLLFFLSLAIYIYATICISIRRLHDLNRSGWFVLLVLIPVIGMLFMLYLYFAKGDKTTNQYGPYRPTEQTERILGIFSIILITLYLLATLALSVTLPDVLEQQLATDHHTQTQDEEESTVDQMPRHLDEVIRTRPQPAPQVEVNNEPTVIEEVPTIVQEESNDTPTQVEDPLDSQSLNTDDTEQ